MARTSKNKQADRGSISVPAKIYSVGIYARLSVDANERKNESVLTQVEIAKAFVGQQKDMVIHDCYIDIGRTGTNFEREAFERMMQDVRMHKINCIIVKDLSRFGRNHIETGNYIQKIFPFMGVRFIAVTDNFDSMNISGQNEALGVNLKNLVNEMYARDIGVKVRSARQTRWEQGSYTGGVPPYGYRAEWIGDKRCLFIEEAAADIVRKIFDLFLCGRNMKEIVVWLYERGIVRPAEYHKTGEILCKDRERLLQWSVASVKMLLTNPVYTGCLVRGGSGGKECMMRDRHDIDSISNLMINEHTHEAIISEDIFFEAAARFEKSSVYSNKNGYSKTVPIEEDIFADVLYCGDCGSKMKRITSVKLLSSKLRVRTYSYNCPRHDRIDEGKCVSKSITLQTLQGIVKEAVRQEFSLSAMRPKELTEANIREAEAVKKEWNRELNTLEKKLENLKRLGSEQYLKYRTGEMDKEAFHKEKEENAKKTASIQSMHTDISKRLRDIDAQTVQKNRFLRALVRGDEKAELNEDVIRTLIHKIEVYQDRRIKVIFTFQRTNIL